MKIHVNNEEREVSADNLAALIDELGLADAAVATALNGEFAPARMRAGLALRAGDRVEILAPMRGG
ncbi:sulfur carrier protein ThiS [Acidisoma sp. C75]